MFHQIDENRLYWIDVIRIIAIILIIFMHSPIPDSGTPGFVLSGLSFLTGPGIGLFLMISGALLLGTELNTSDFLKRRFGKVVWPTLIWTAIYLAEKVAVGEISISQIVRGIFSIPFSVQGHGMLWFMYTLAGLYLLTPILSKWLKGAIRSEVRFYLLLWGVTLLYPYLSLLLDIDTHNTGILYYFSGYVGYFILGYYLKKWVTPNSITLKIKVGCWLTIFLCTALVGIVKIKYPDAAINDFFWYLSLPMALMATSYFILLSNVAVPNSIKPIVTKLSALSFGVYLCHILVMRSFLWNIDFIQNSGFILHIPIVAVLTIITSWLLSYFISKLPFSKYIIAT